MKTSLFVLLCLLATLPVKAIEACSENITARLSVDPGHPWRPPFGLDRVGKPLTAVVEISSEQMPSREYFLAGLLDGKEVGRYAVLLAHKKSGWTGRVSFETYPTELVLYAKCRFQGEPVEVARQSLQPPPFEADAVAQPAELVNPTDLGTVLVPADWLLLSPASGGTLEVAAISRSGDVQGAHAAAWFESNPRAKVSAPIPIVKNQKAQVKLPLPPTPAVEHDVLHVRLTDADGKELWQKPIQTMIVRTPPRLPNFGAFATKLRYDAPMLVIDPETSKSSFIKYEEAWDPHLEDVVVSLPNGARFVFWRGSSYVPFWVSRHGLGLTYEWAEREPPPEAFNDAVEPLMDKELRYGRVEIIESTSARVHVRWSYQSCDFKYKVFGDAAVEDFYFYPDSFGTRALTIRSSPSVEWELSEFIILTPTAAYPLAVLPSKMADILFLDGDKREVSFPFHVEGDPKKWNMDWPEDMTKKIRGTPAVYRIRFDKDDAATAIYFNPLDPYLPHPYGCMGDRNQLVTPAYWGSHWPLVRGKKAGESIDDLIGLNPAHNSLMTWAHDRPAPIRTARLQTLDALGRSETIAEQQWVWQIGMTDEPDARLLERARSFAQPPSLELKGAKFDFDPYVPERRALRLIVEEPLVTMTVKPTVKCVNPVFELSGAPGQLEAVTLAGRRLQAKDFAWDGKTLWLNADINEPEQIELQFGKGSR